MIGKVIQEKRKELGMTQAQLADYLGVTAPAVNRWEKDLSYPDADLLAPLARLLKTDINTLFSFYDALSDNERELAVDHARNMFLRQPDDEAFSYIDDVLKQNLSDGLLFKEMASMLFGFHMFRKHEDPQIYLDRVSAYYERALELIPDEEEDISYSLMGIYAEMGLLDKAEEAWSRIRNAKINKEWAHAELMQGMKIYDRAIPEMKSSILRAIVQLSDHLELLRNTLLKAGDLEASELARVKSEQLRELFELWDGFNVVSNLSHAVESDDADDQISHIRELINLDASGSSVSSCSLFKDVSLGTGSDGERTSADIMADIMGILQKKQSEAASE